MTYAPLQILLILVIAPSAIYASPLPFPFPQPPGSAGHHGSVQGGAFPFSQFRQSPRDALIGSAQAQTQDIDDRPATSQHMSMNNDGRYSFSYSAGSSAREERRQPDGSVQGKYSYVDPTGKLVEVEYTADAASGFNAYGENVPPRTISYAPHPVQDTPDVAAARAKFLAYYQQEWNHRKALEAIENATATPNPNSGETTVSSSSDLSLPTDASPHRIPLKPAPEKFADDDEDTEIVNRDDAESDNPPISPLAAKFGNPQPLSSISVGQAGNVGQSSAAGGQQIVGDGASYSLNFDVGNTQPAGPFGQSFNQPQIYASQQQQPQQQHQHQQQHQQQAMNSASVQSVQGPGYFYYMSVGGLPYYVTSLPTRTNIAVSVRASQLGAIPAAAVHDVQSPHYGGSVYRPKQTPAVYVEVGQDYNDVGKTPASTVSSQNFRPQLQYQAQGQLGQISQSSRYPSNFPYFGYPVYVY